MSVATPWSSGFEENAPRLITSYTQPPPVLWSENDVTDGQATIELVRDSALAHMGEMVSRHNVERWVSGSTIYCGLIRRQLYGEAWLSDVYTMWNMRFLNLAAGKDLGFFYYMGPKYNRHRSMALGIRGNSALVIEPSPMVGRYPWPAAPAATFPHIFSTDRWHNFEAWMRIGVNGELGVRVDGAEAYRWIGDTSIPTILNPDGETYTGAQGIDVGILRQRDTENSYSLLMDDFFMGPIPLVTRRISVGANAFTGGRLRRTG